MSGFVAIVDPSKRLLAEASVARMLGALAPRGDRSEVKRDGECVLAVTRFEWELADGFSGPTLLVTDGDLSVVADASVYYRDDLLRSLHGAGVRPAGSSVAHLIAAAYRAWGSDCTKYLEGDYSFVIYDHKQRRTFAARDFLGRRPLYFVEIGDALLVSSSVSAIVAHPACSTELDDVALAEFVCVSLAGASTHTISRGERGPAGHVARSATRWGTPGRTSIGVSTLATVQTPSRSMRRVKSSATCWVTRSSNDVRWPAPRRSG